jgi:hypothetical protein
MSLAIFNTREKGNALFLILIAVALFAALTYAITQSSRSGTGDATREQDTINAAAITQIGASIAQSYMRMTLTGTAAANIVYANPPGGDCPGINSAGGADYAPFCASGTDCFFSSDGGGAPVPHVPPSVYAPSFQNYATAYKGVVLYGPGTGACSSVGVVSGLGTGAAELIFAVQGIKQGVCDAINRGLGVTPSGPNGGTWTPISATTGQQAACFDFGAPYSGMYVYYQVLQVN